MLDRMASIKKKEITNAGRDVEKRELLWTVGGNVNWYSTMENSVEDPQKIKNRTITFQIWDYIQRK